MWAQALPQYWKHPWLGYGFTTGGTTLEEPQRGGISAVSQRSPSQGSLTLHNGYLQALLDSGAIGAALYTLMIISALVCFLRYDRHRRYGAEFYCLLFLAVANLGETVIFGAGVLHGVWYWYLTVLALALPSLASAGASARALAGPARAVPVGQSAGSPVAMKSPAVRFPLVASPKGSS